MSDLSTAIEVKGALLGTLVTNLTPAGVEALSHTPLDWLLIDLEHSTIDLREAQAMVQAAQPDCLVFLRIEEASPVYVKRALDTGCDGLIVPQVNSPELARQIADAGRFAPMGNRSIGLGRALGYGLTLADGVREENGRVAILVQIEHRHAIEQVDAIAATPGIDGLFVGPFDLSASFGVPGQLAHPEVAKAIESVPEAAARAGKVAGVFTPGPAGAITAIERGFELVAVGSDIALLSQSCASVVETVRTRPQ